MKLPETLKLTWHNDYEKDYPKGIGAYCIIVEHNEEKFFDYAIFVPYRPEPHINCDCWRPLLGNADIYVGDSGKTKVIAWAEINPS